MDQDDLIPLIITVTISLVAVVIGVVFGIRYSRKAGLIGLDSRRGVGESSTGDQFAQTDASSSHQREPTDNRSGILGFLQRHPNLTVAATALLVSLVSWRGTLRTEDIDPLLNGRAAQAFAAFLVFIAANQYIVWLRVVPKVRRLKGYDMSYRAALLQAAAPPIMGMVATFATGLSWPFWTCIGFAVVGSIGPFSVLKLTRPKSNK